MLHNQAPKQTTLTSRITKTSTKTLAQTRRGGMVRASLILVILCGISEGQTNISSFKQICQQIFFLLICYFIFKLLILWYFTCLMKKYVYLTIFSAIFWSAGRSLNFLHDGGLGVLVNTSRFEEKRTCNQQIYVAQRDSPTRFLTYNFFHQSITPEPKNNAQSGFD